jgi:hypothetical protein
LRLRFIPRIPRRRPSAAIVISSAALFLSLGGVGYAASGMIGTDQIKNNAVTFSKIAPNAVGKVRLANGGVINSKIASGAVSFGDIQPGAVGAKRANLNQLQARLKNTCATGTAVTSIDSKGNATCTPTLPAEYGTTSNTATVTGTATTVSSLTLPAGPTYLAFADPQASVTSGATAERVNVTCTLTVGSNSVSRTAALRSDGTAGDVTTAALPLQLAGTSGTASLSCTASTVNTTVTLPTVTVNSGINALQTASNN